MKNTMIILGTLIAITACSGDSTSEKNTNQNSNTKEAKNEATVPTNTAPTKKEVGKLKKDWQFELEKDKMTDVPEANAIMESSDGRTALVVLCKGSSELRYVIFPAGPAMVATRSLGDFSSTAKIRAGKKELIEADIHIFQNYKAFAFQSEKSFREYVGAEASLLVEYQLSIPSGSRLAEFDISEIKPAEEKILKHCTSK